MKEKENKFKITKFNTIALRRSIEKDNLEELSLFSNDELISIVKDFKIIHLAAFQNAIKCLNYLTNKLGKDVLLHTDENGQTALHKAAQEGRIEAIEFLLDKGVDINAKNKEGHTPLKLLLQRPYSNTLTKAKYLINKGADINFKNENGDTLLHNNANIEHLELFIDNGLDINTPNNQGNTPLHLLAKWGMDSAIKYLIERGANINAKNNQGDTPLHLNISLHNSSCIKRLTESYADVNAKNKEGHTPLHLKASQPSVMSWLKLTIEEVEKIIIQAKAKDEYFNEKLKDPEFIEGLTYRGIDIQANKDKCGNTLLENAEFIQLLTGNGIDINTQDKDVNTPLLSLLTSNLCFISQNNITNHIQRQINAINQLQLISINKFKQLIKYGADVKAQDNNGNTPLHIAVARKNLEVIKCLIENGADINAQNEESDSPLNCAHRLKNETIIKWFNIAAVLTKICELQPVQKDDAFVNLFGDEDGLETFVKNFTVSYLVKNGIADDYLEKFKEYIKVLPKNIAGDMQNCLEQLISESSWQLQVLEGQLRMFIEGISNIPYGLLENLKGQLFLNKSEYSLREFYKTHPEFKDAGNYLLYVLGFESQIENLPCLNYIMLINEDISLLVKDLYNKFLIPSALKEELREVINQHTVFYSHKDELFNLIDLQQLYEELAVEQVDKNKSVSETVTLAEFLKPLNNDESDNNEVDIAGTTNGDSLD